MPSNEGEQPRKSWKIIWNLFPPFFELLSSSWLISRLVCANWKRNVNVSNVIRPFPSITLSNLINNFSSRFLRLFHQLESSQKCFEDLFVISVQLCKQKSIWNSNLIKLARSNMCFVSISIDWIDFWIAVDYWLKFTKCGWFFIKKYLYIFFMILIIKKLYFYKLMPILDISNCYFNKTFNICLNLMEIRPHHVYFCQ